MRNTSLDKGHNTLNLRWNSPPYISRYFSSCFFSFTLLNASFEGGRLSVTSFSFLLVFFVWMWEPLSALFLFFHFKADCFFFGKGAVFKKEYEVPYWVSSEGYSSMDTACMKEGALAITSVECDIVIRVVYKSYDTFMWKIKHIYIQLQALCKGLLNIRDIRNNYTVTSL